MISFRLCFRCCCFFKRKKKKGGRGKWLAVVQCSPEREAVTLLHATSQSNSRDSVLNPAVTWKTLLADTSTLFTTQHAISVHLRFQFNPYVYIFPQLLFLIFFFLEFTPLVWLGYIRWTVVHISGTEGGICYFWSWINHMLSNFGLWCNSWVIAFHF